MNTCRTVALVLGLLIFGSQVIFSQSVGFRLFLKDINKCQELNNEEFVVLNEFFGGLDKDSLEYYASGFGDETTAPSDRCKDAESKYNLFKDKQQAHLSRLSKEYSVPFGLGSFRSLYLSLLCFRFILGDDTLEMEIDSRAYKMTDSEKVRAAELYADYLADYLDKIQQLRKMYKTSNLQPGPKLNGMLSKYSNFITTDGENAVESAFVLSKMTGWEHLRDRRRNDASFLFKSQKVLKIAKLYYEWLIGNGFVMAYGDNHEERLLLEIERIDNLLKKMSREASSNDQVIQAINHNDVKEPSKNKETQEEKTNVEIFRLNLPE